MNKVRRGEKTLRLANDFFFLHGKISEEQITEGDGWQTVERCSYVIDLHTSSEQMTIRRWTTHKNSLLNCWTRSISSRYTFISRALFFVPADDLAHTLFFVVIIPFWCHYSEGSSFVCNIKWHIFHLSHFFCVVSRGHIFHLLHFDWKFDSA